ncbi:hypothetical protein AVEN_75497-1 [Araneus ventricosus]|uniref:Uncharacterized protein n=1 Tax=Araneus ventricosus TaxID=182803 RepID=A0A4Y2DMM4_ARAVE|nr:hypothetical protein AVEN_75497-1 [Araneus ventricosus]
MHSRDSVIPTTMPVIKQRDTNEDCAKTLASTKNKREEDANTSFIEEKSVKDRSPPEQEPFDSFCTGQIKVCLFVWYVDGIHDEIVLKMLLLNAMGCIN